MEGSGATFPNNLLLLRRIWFLNEFGPNNDCPQWLLSLLFAVVPTVIPAFADFDLPTESNGFRPTINSGTVSPLIGFALFRSSSFERADGRALGRPLPIDIRAKVDPGGETGGSCTGGFKFRQFTFQRMAHLNLIS